MAKKNAVTNVVEEKGAGSEGLAEGETVAAPVKEEKVAVKTKAQLSQEEADAFPHDTDAIYFGEKNADGTYNALETEGLPVISRAAAILKGFSRYFTGEACKKGHISPRKTKSSVCVACAREKLKERHARRLQDDPDYKAKFAAKAKDRRLRKKAKRVAVTDATPPTETASAPAE